MDRRQFLRSGLVGGAGLVAASQLSEAKWAAALTPGWGPFRHGVASGDPLPSGFIIWTRVTPNDYAIPGSGIGDDLVVM